MCKNEHISTNLLKSQNKSVHKLPSSCVRKNSSLLEQTWCDCQTCYQVHLTRRYSHDTTIIVTLMPFTLCHKQQLNFKPGKSDRKKTLYGVTLSLIVFVSIYILMLCTHVYMIFHIISVTTLGRHVFSLPVVDTNSE